jgi:hypothetical protein
LGFWLDPAFCDTESPYVDSDFVTCPLSCNSGRISRAVAAAGKRCSSENTWKSSGRILVAPNPLTDFPAVADLRHPLQNRIAICLSVIPVPEFDTIKLSEASLWDFLMGRRNTQDVEGGAKYEIEFQSRQLLFHGGSWSRICDSVVAYVEKNWRGHRCPPMLDEMLQIKQRNL